MGVSLKAFLKRDGLFMRCFITVVAVGWVSLLVSDYSPPHIAPFRHGLHWLEAVGTSLLAVLAWAGPRRDPPPAREAAGHGETLVGGGRRAVQDDD